MRNGFVLVLSKVCIAHMPTNISLIPICRVEHTLWNNKNLATEQKNRRREKNNDTSACWWVLAETHAFSLPGESNPTQFFLSLTLSLSYPNAKIYRPSEKCSWCEIIRGEEKKENFVTIFQLKELLVRLHPMPIYIYIHGTHAHIL